MDPLSIARYGMRAAAMRFEASAARVASGDAAQVDYVTETVEQIQARQAFSANLNTIRVADEMWGALMDIQVGRR